YHDKTKVGDSLYRIAYDTQAAQSLLSGAVVPMASGVLVLVGIVLVMLRIDAVMTAAALAIAPLFWLLIKLFGRMIERHSQAYHEGKGARVSLVQKSLSSTRAVQAFTRDPEPARQFSSQTDESLAANSRLVRVQLMFSACIGMAMAAGTAAVVGFGAY